MAIYLIVIIMKITALVSQAKGRLFFYGLIVTSHCISNTK